MKKLLLVMNPYAGTRKANRYLPEIISIFNRAGYDVHTYVTAATGDATDLITRRGAEMDLIVCIGGDGTFNETITGLMRCGAKIPIGYIPAGSTNDFASSLHLSTNILEAAQDIVRGTPVSYDVGKFGDRYFSYIASFGAFTRTAYATPQNIKNALGHTGYLLEGIQELSQIKNIHLRFETDSEIIEDDFIFGAISNSTSIGGLLTLDPKQVDMGDGKFELLLVRSPKDLSEVSECIRALQSQKYNCNMITFLSSSLVRVTAPADLPWTLDGERADGQAHILAENMHLAITLMQNKERLC